MDLLLLTRSTRLEGSGVGHGLGVGAAACCSARVVAGAGRTRAVADGTAGLHR